MTSSHKLGADTDWTSILLQSCGVCPSVLGRTGKVEIHPDVLLQLLFEGSVH